VALWPRAVLPTGRRLWALTVPLLALAIAAPWTWHLHFAKNDAAMAGFWQVLEAAPRQSRLLYFVESVPPLGVRSNLFRHLGQYHTVVNEGVTQFSFANHPGRLVEQRVPGFAFEWATWGHVDAPTTRQGFDVLLKHGDTPIEARWQPAPRLLARSGRWTLHDLRPPVP